MSLMQKGIRRRWMVNSIGTVSFVLLVAMISFSRSLWATTTTTVFAPPSKPRPRRWVTSLSSYATSESTYLEMANYYINDFDERESLELQFISTSGQIVLSSYGLTSGGSPGTRTSPRPSTPKMYSAGPVGDPSTGERIMAVSAPILYGNDVKGVVRLVSSLSIVDRQFMLLILIALGCASGRCPWCTSPTCTLSAPSWSP